MKIHLAPMEGVVNARMRALLTTVGGIDRCVTEFVRVTDRLLPPKVFHRLCPELLDGGTTPTGTPVYLQLLGSDPAAMADNAARAAELGAPGVDTNFGCPAKCVNRHRGGSILLDEPELIHAIVVAMRQSMPSPVPLTVKIRLGYQDHSRLLENIDAIASAGAAEITIHARTRDDGYKPPAFWDKIAAVHGRPLNGANIIANGEVWTPEHYWQCRLDSHCDDVMLGRGLLARPDLARHIKAQQADESYRPMPWLQALDLLDSLFEDSLVTCAPRHVGGPLKQWLGYLRRHYREADQLFATIKRLTQPDDLQNALAQHRRQLCEQAHAA